VAHAAVSSLEVYPTPALKPVSRAASVLRDGQMSDKPKQKRLLGNDGFDAGHLRIEG
jgi:hypothetical protein